jgi:uncharacterized Fe-S cluster protein YjdI/CDGSH-type Zn-finger protein
MAKRSYETDELVVHWDSQRCIHTAICIDLLPSVFDPATRPWVRVANAPTEAIVGAIERCPTGALRYERTTGPPERGADPTLVVPVPNGPLVLRGRLRVVGPGDATIAEEARLTLCRCGASRNQPFCDNSHRRVRFESRDPSPPLDGDRAETPAEICPPQDEVFPR